MGDRHFHYRLRILLFKGKDIFLVTMDDPVDQGHKIPALGNSFFLFKFFFDYIGYLDRLCKLSGEDNNAFFDFLRERLFILGPAHINKKTDT